VDLGIVLGPRLAGFCCSMALMDSLFEQGVRGADWLEVDCVIELSESPFTAGGAAVGAFDFGAEPGTLSDI